MSFVKAIGGLAQGPGLAQGQDLALEQKQSPLLSVPQQLPEQQSSTSTSSPPVLSPMQSPQQEQLSLSSPSASPSVDSVSKSDLRHNHSVLTQEGMVDDRSSGVASDAGHTAAGYGCDGVSLDDSNEGLWDGNKSTESTVPVSPSVPTITSSVPTSTSMYTSTAVPTTTAISTTATPPTSSSTTTSSSSIASVWGLKNISMDSPCVRSAGALFASPEVPSQSSHIKLLRSGGGLGLGLGAGRGGLESCEEEVDREQQTSMPDEQEEGGEEVEQEGVSFFDDLRWECATDDMISDVDDDEEGEGENLRNEASSTINNTSINSVVNNSYNHTSVNLSKMSIISTPTATKTSEAPLSSTTTMSKPSVQMMHTSSTYPSPSPSLGSDAFPEDSTETKASSHRSHYARGAAAVCAITLLLCYLRATTTTTIPTMYHNNNINNSNNNNDDNVIPTNIIPTIATTISTTPTTTNGHKSHPEELMDATLPLVIGDTTADTTGSTTTTTTTTERERASLATDPTTTSARSIVASKEQYQSMVKTKSPVAVIEIEEKQKMAVSSQVTQEGLAKGEGGMKTIEAETTFAGTIRTKQPQQPQQQLPQKSLSSSSRDKLSGLTSRSIPPAVITTPITTSITPLGGTKGTAGNSAFIVANPMINAVRKPLLPEDYAESGIKNSLANAKYSRDGAEKEDVVAVVSTSATTTTAKETIVSSVTRPVSTINNNDINDSNSDKHLDKFQLVNTTTSSSSLPPSVPLLPTPSSSLWRSLSLHPYCNVFAWSLSWLFLDDDDACVSLTSITGTAGNK